MSVWTRKTAAQMITRSLTPGVMKPRQSKLRRPTRNEVPMAKVYGVETRASKPCFRGYCRVYVEVLICSIGSLVEFFAGEMKQGIREKTEHDDAKEGLGMRGHRQLVVGSDRGPKFGA